MHFRRTLLSRSLLPLSFLPLSRLTDFVSPSLLFRSLLSQSPFQWQVNPFSPFRRYMHAAARLHSSMHRSAHYNTIKPRYSVKVVKTTNLGIVCKPRPPVNHPNDVIIIIMNFYSPVSNTRCHSIGHKMRIARIKIRVDSPGRWERA